MSTKRERLFRDEHDALLERVARLEDENARACATRSKATKDGESATDSPEDSRRGRGGGGSTVARHAARRRSSRDNFARFHFADSMSNPVPTARFNLVTSGFRGPSQRISP